MSQPDETPALPPSFDIPSWPPGEFPAGPSIVKPVSRLDHVFNFQIVVFEVYFLPSNLHLKKRSQHLFKRSRIRSSRFLGMASTFREPLSRQCLHYRRHQRMTTVMKAAVLKIPFICQESRWNTFGPSCASYIRCAF